MIKICLEIKVSIYLSLIATALLWCNLSQCFVCLFKFSLWFLVTVYIFANLPETKPKQVYNRDSVKIDEFLLKDPGDINAKQMRVLLPAMLQKINYPDKDVTKTKIKGLWEPAHKPSDYPANLPFKDPNNGLLYHKYWYIIYISVLSVSHVIHIDIFRSICQTSKTTTWAYWKLCCKIQQTLFPSWL